MRRDASCWLRLRYFRGRIPAGNAPIEGIDTQCSVAMVTPQVVDTLTGGVQAGNGSRLINRCALSAARRETRSIEHLPSAIYTNPVSPSMFQQSHFHGIEGTLHDLQGRFRLAEILVPAG